MAAGDMRVGLDGKFLYGTHGSTATTEADSVDNVVLTMSARMAEAIRRGKTWLTKKPTILETSLSFDVFDIEGEALRSAILAAFTTKGRVALYPTDAASGEGLDADYYISGCNRNESNPEFIMYNVTAEPTDEGRDPSWG